MTIHENPSIATHPSQEAMKHPVGLAVKRGTSSKSDRLSTSTIPETSAVLVQDAFSIR